MSSNPKLSIITIAYNNKFGLIKTMQSVFSQTYNNIEYIVVDGGSEDGSKEILEKESKKIDYWVSEPDNGIYNALNKGITKSTGEYLLFLNSGDWFLDDDILSTFMKNLGDYDIIYGNKINYYSDDKLIEEKSPAIVDFYILAFSYSLPHQATIFKKKLFNEMGLYDESLKIVADWKFTLLAIFKYNYKYCYKDLNLIYYDMNGISSCEANSNLQLSERAAVIDSHFRNIKHMEKESLLIQKLKFYYKYSRVLRVLKMLGIIKKFEY